MTATEFLKEICLRAGEGYREYTDRAKSYAKSVMIEMARQLPDIDIQAPAMVVRKRNNIARATQFLIPYDEISTNILNAEIINILSLSYETKGEPNTYTAKDNLGADSIIYQQQPSMSNREIYVEHILHPDIGWDTDVIINKDRDNPNAVIITVRLEHYGGNTIATAGEVLKIVNESSAQKHVRALAAPGANMSERTSEFEKQKLTGRIQPIEYRAERISQAEFDAYLLRPDLLMRKDNFNFYTISDGKLWLVKEPGHGWMVSVVAVVWQDAFITPDMQSQADKNELSKKFSAGFIQRTIDIASERMRAEIQA